MRSPSASQEWSVIVLSGGRGIRLGGVDKAGLRIAGMSNLDRLLTALPADAPVVVAGPERATVRPVDFRPERPPDGGPVAGIAAAVPAVRTSIVALLAVDMPFGGDLIARLVGEFADCPADALVPVDATGRRQPLCSVVRTDALRAALSRIGEPAGQPMHRLMRELSVQERPLTADEERLAIDIDTADDLERAHGTAARNSVRTARMSLEPGDHAMDTWITAVCLELGIEAQVDVDVILDVARVAAHNVERPAAPVTTFLLGLAVAGGADAASAAKMIEALAEGWTQPE